MKSFTIFSNHQILFCDQLKDAARMWRKRYIQGFGETNYMWKITWVELGVDDDDNNIKIILLKLILVINQLNAQIVL